jgi:peptidoglycan/LPS O-acetylase OafA/YrhL
LKNRIAWLDLFRGLAAVMVVLFHYRGYLGMSTFGIGFVAVDGFFVLSGIVLAMKYTDAIAEGMPFRAFAEARLKRLYPMAFIAGVLILVLDLLDTPANPFMGANRSGLWSVFLLLIPQVGGITTGQGAAYPADVPLWSLWAELVANAIWFAVLRGGRRWMPWVGAVAMFAVVMFGWQYQSLDIGWRDSLDMRAFTVARALAWFSVGYWIARTTVKPVGSPFVLTIGLIAVFVAFVSGVPVTWYGSFATVALAAALLHALYKAPPPPAVVGQAARWLGLISFPLYLVHGPAGRLLPYFADAGPHWLVLPLLILPVAVAATILNEWIVGWLHRRPSRSDLARAG